MSSADRRNRIADYLVYVAVRIVVCVIQALPVEAGYTMAGWLARLAFLVDKRHRQVAIENLERAFGDRYTEPQRQRLVLGVYEHFLRVMVEIAHIPRKLRLSNYRRYITFESAQPALTCMLDSRPKILLMGHFGNWEMSGFLLGALGVKVHAIARDLDNPYLHEFVMRFRQFTGQAILSKNGDFERIAGVLSTGGILASVADQSAGPRGYFVDFFGRPASTHKSIAVLAMRYNAPVIVGYAFRDRADFHYTVGCSRILDPADYVGADGLMELTRDFTRLLEDAIRRAPEQYLWLHNRWKHTPPPAKEKRRLAA